MNIVQQLIEIQFPQWENLIIQPVPISGWDNSTFRLGDDLLIRMTSSVDYVEQVDANRALELWERALKTKWDEKGVWVHGDLTPTNILVFNGKIQAVIDFGQLTTGDPACDLSIYWTFLSGDIRSAFQTALKLDKKPGIEHELGHSGKPRFKPLLPSKSFFARNC